MEDLTGKRFGRLVVERKIPRKIRGRVFWECKCDCGNVKTVESGNLKNGHTKSCGCLSKEMIETVGLNNLIDLVGNKYGRLTVVKDSGKRKSSKNVIWECKCDCGNKTYVESGNLKNGNVRSCGCLFLDFIEMDCVEDTKLTSLTAKISKANKSGVKGVWWDSYRQKWKAKITFQRQVHELGYFTKLEDAAKARKEAEEKYFTPILEKYGTINRTD